MAKIEMTTTLESLHLEELLALSKVVTSLISTRKEKKVTSLSTPNNNKRQKTNNEDESNTNTKSRYADANPYNILSTETEQMETNVDDITQKDTDSGTRKGKPTKKPSTINKIQPSTPETNGESSTQIKQQKIVPIFLKEKEKWTTVQQIILKNKINTTKCRMTATSIQIDPATAEDYRNLKKVLQSENIQFFTFDLPSEKKLKVVIRGVITQLSEEEIKKDLEEQGYPATRVIRMKGRQGTVIPLVLVEIDKQFKTIYDIRNCCGLAVKIESLRLRNNIIQCHRCQLFGHTQKNCNVQYQCMKCGEPHSTHLCTKPKTTAPKCANCSGEHLSTYLYCKENPNNPKQAKTVIPPANPNVWKEKAAQRHQQIPTTSTPSTIQQTNTDQLANILGKMILNIAQTNATQQQIADFISQTQQIVKIFNNKRQW